MTLTELKQIISYDPETGVVKWLVDRPGRVKAGDYVGSTTGKTRINGVNYPVNRLCVWLHKGYYPRRQVRTHNGDVTDYRWSNLRILREPIPRSKQPMRKLNLLKVAQKRWPMVLTESLGIVEEDGFYRLLHPVTKEEVGLYFTYEEAREALTELMNSDDVFKEHTKKQKKLRKEFIIANRTSKRFIVDQECFSIHYSN